MVIKTEIMTLVFFLFIDSLLAFKVARLLVTSPLNTDNTVIEEVEHIRFLGVYIDQHLAWKTHINLACTKVSKTIGMLHKARFYVSRISLP